MARIIAGPAWVDTDAQRFVASWFNQLPSRGTSAFTANRTTTSAVPAEFTSGTEIRVEFLSWATSIRCVAEGSFAVSALVSAGIQVDVVTGGIDARMDWVCISVGNTIPVTSVGFMVPTEGYHYATLLGYATGGNTLTGIGGALGSGRCKVMVELDQ